MEGLARNTDPETSHEAAASIEASRLMQIIYDVMKSYGDSGCIGEDVERNLPDIRGCSITPRFHQMLELGMIELTGERRKASSGRFQEVRRTLEPPFVPWLNSLPKKDAKIRTLEIELMQARAEIHRLKTNAAQGSLL